MKSYNFSPWQSMIDMRGNLPVQDCMWVGRCDAKHWTLLHYAIALMQDVLIVAPTIDVQHSQPVAKRNVYEKVPFRLRILSDPHWATSAGHHGLETRISLTMVRVTRLPCIDWSACGQLTGT